MREPAIANPKRTTPSPATISRLVSAQCGIRAVSSVKAISSSAGTKSKTRCAKTVPSSVAVAPFLARHPPREHRDAGELAEPARQDGVREQPDAEGGERPVERRVRCRAAPGR